MVNPDDNHCAHFAAHVLNLNYPAVLLEELVTVQNPRVAVCADGVGV